MMVSEKIRAAQQLAREQHTGQKRKHGPDYDVHPEDVAGLIAVRYGLDDEDVVCAALLHDVIEESETSEETIAAQFGRRVADMVAALTRDKKRPYREYAERLAQQPPEVLLIKGADVLSNLRDSALADGPTRRRVVRIAVRYVLPLLRKRFGVDHTIVRDLENLVAAVRRRSAFSFLWKD